jgi:hypothetical protein
MLEIFFRNRNIHLHKKRDGNWGLRKTTPGGPRKENNGAVLPPQSRAVSNIHKLQKNVLQTIFSSSGICTFCPSDHSWRISSIQNLKKSLIHSWLVGEEVFASFP